MDYSNLQFFGFQPTSIVALLLALVSVLLGFLGLRKKFSHYRPKASCALPLTGLLHVFMNRDDLIHVTLGNMADEYGPIFSFPTGSHRTLVVSSWEIVKECFTGSNDTVFSNRPVPLAFKIIFYAGGIDSYGLALVPYGKQWRELRKICVHNLLSNQQLLKFRQSIISQVDASFSKLYESCNSNRNSDDQGVSSTTASGSVSSTSAASMVRMDDWLAQLSFNVIGRIQFTVAMDEASRFMSITAVSDTVPWLGWIDQLTGLTRKMKHSGKKLDLVVESIIEDHRQKRQFARTKGDENTTEDEQDDFIDICLSIMEQPQLPGDNNPRQIPIKSIVLDMIGAGVDATKLTTIWTLSLLLNNPHVLDKAKEEVDAHFGTKRRRSANHAVMVDFDDIRSLVYIQAIVKESMRLYPASPIVERLSSEDCVVGGFHVPAGTRLWANVWKMQRDPKVWGDPLVFRPERFLSNDQKKMVDVRGQNYELIPFGAGRRICPGISFSLDLMHLVLTRLILEFEMKSPGGGEVDMTATPGLMSYKVVPLDILLTARML
ncbi:hypothetical protein MKW94_003301 [Papaver nudicaule]|uniref:Cytochrome P450 n=1 Tax=Papaver nudicaule TaxID=74823 RepID=A0AA41VNB4_PAPNU|nr:hypothetical protein [Papaver nudicaule]